jgi:hypothetical protein
MTICTVSIMFDDEYIVFIVGIISTIITQQVNSTNNNI